MHIRLKSKITSIHPVFLVFTILIIVRIVLWLAVEWPDYTGRPAAATEDAVVKIAGLPVWLMVYWPDSGRYWFTLQELVPHWNINYSASVAFFGFVRLISDNIAYGVLALNIVSLLTAWILSRMLVARNNAFAAVVLLISFLNLFTISMEYAILREVLARFCLILALLAAH